MKGSDGSPPGHSGIPSVYTRVDSATRAEWPSVSSITDQTAGSKLCGGGEPGSFSSAERALMANSRRLGLPSHSSLQAADRLGWGTKRVRKERGSEEGFQIFLCSHLREAKSQERGLATLDHKQMRMISRLSTQRSCVAVPAFA